MAVAIRKVRTVVFAVLIIVGGVTPAAAQHARQGALDLTLGSHYTAGGAIDYRQGLLADVFAAARLHHTERWSAVGGVGLSGVAGGFGDRCLLVPRSDGGSDCAPQANFVAVSMLGGGTTSLGGGSARLMVGPSYYSGGDEHGLGVQTRVDLTSADVAHFAIGVMGRVTWLPSFGGQSLRTSAIGVSLSLR